jgi:hypothetical protein
VPEPAPGRGVVHHERRDGPMPILLLVRHGGSALARTAWLLGETYPEFGERVRSALDEAPPAPLPPPAPDNAEHLTAHHRSYLQHWSNRQRRPGPDPAPARTPPPGKPHQPHAPARPQRSRRPRPRRKSAGNPPTPPDQGSCGQARLDAAHLQRPRPPRTRPTPDHLPLRSTYPTADGQLGPDGGGPRAAIRTRHVNRWPPRGTPGAAHAWPACPFPGGEGRRGSRCGAAPCSRPGASG